MNYGAKREGVNKNGSVQNKILQRAVRKDNLGKGEEVEGTW